VPCWWWRICPFKGNSKNPGMVDASVHCCVLDDIAVSYQTLDPNRDYNPTKKLKLCKFNNEEEAVELLWQLLLCYARTALTMLVCFQVICLAYLTSLIHRTSQPSRRAALLRMKRVHHTVHPSAGGHRTTMQGFITVLFSV
jgi:hypothetical protein